MRKKIIAFILCSVCLSMLNGCTYEEKKQIGNEGGTGDKGEFLGVISGFNLDLYKEDDSSKKLVIDEKLALEIGDSVLASVFGKDVLDITKFCVFELESEGVFVVSRYNNQTLGGDYNVAISKEDGSIIKIWSGE